MKLFVVAVGHRMPAWVEAGFDEFARRMPRELPLQLIEVKAEPRTSGKTVDAMMAAEAGRIGAVLPPRCRRVILDERGADRSVMNRGAQLLGSREDQRLRVDAERNLLLIRGGVPGPTGGRLVVVPSVKHKNGGK